MADTGSPLPQGLGASEGIIAPWEERAGQTLELEIFLKPAGQGGETLGHRAPRQRGEWGGTHGSPWRLNLLERRQNLVREKVPSALPC